jgi:hypothetical protein
VIWFRFGVSVLEEVGRVGVVRGERERGRLLGDSER